MISLSMSIQTHIMTIATGICIIPSATITTFNNQLHMRPRMVTVMDTTDIMTYLLLSLYRLPP